MNVVHLLPMVELKLLTTMMDLDAQNVQVGCERRRHLALYLVE